ncbi:MAG: YceI family protein [Flavobacteriaceae bacterium]
MKKTPFLLLFLASFSLAFANPIVVKSGTVNWTGYKVTGQHTGTLDLKSGSIDIQNGALVGGTFVVDMTSLTVTDLKGKGKANLEGHLKSDDFFGVEAHNEAHMKITQVRGDANGYTVTGDFTIKGQTHSVVFDMTLSKNSATAKVKIDRTLYNIRYGSDSFFDNLGNKAIDNEFDIEVTLNF